MLEVTIVLLGGNLASTALGPIEVFHSAGTLWPALRHAPPQQRFNVTVASLDGGPVSSSYGVSLAAPTTIADVTHTDIIVVPASGLDLDAQLEKHRALFPWLRDRHEQGSYIAGICSGAAYLAEAGLLNGRRATTHWGLAEAYRERYPAVNWRPELMVTEDHGVFCSGGVHGALDLSLYLVEKTCGHEVARQCARSLVVDMPRASQSGYALLPLSRPHDDERIREIEDHMARHHASDLPVKRLSERASMSPRTFLRRFKAATGRLPGRYLQLLRIAVAREMLENTTQPVQTISRRVGYEDLAFFRKLFRRETGMTPAEYRTRFRGEIRTNRIGAA